jgi:hypothetical protein
MEVVADNLMDMMEDSSKKEAGNLLMMILVADNLTEVVEDSLKKEAGSLLTMVLVEDNLTVEAMNSDEEYDSMRIELHLIFTKKKIDLE